MSVIPAVLLQLEKPGAPILTIVKGDTAQFVFTYMQDSGMLVLGQGTNAGSGGTTVFALGGTPVTGTLTVFVNNVLQTQGIHYTLLASNITFIAAPYLGYVITAQYKTAVDLSGLTSTWDLRTAPAATPLYSGTGTVGGTNGTISVTLTTAQTATLVPTGTGNNSNTFVGTLTVKVADTSSNVKTLEKAQTNLVL